MKDDVNILKVYMEVRALEKMRETAFLGVCFPISIINHFVMQAANNLDELRALQITFKDVERISKVFETRLFTLAGDCLQLAQKKPTVLVRTVQVIERECKQDQILRDAFKESGTFFTYYFIVARVGS